MAYGIELTFIRPEGAMGAVQTVDVVDQKTGVTHKAALKPGQSAIVDHYTAWVLTTNFPNCFSVKGDVDITAARAEEAKRQSVNLVNAGAAVPSSPSHVIIADLMNDVRELRLRLNALEELQKPKPAKPDKG